MNTSEFAELVASAQGYAAQAEAAARKVRKALRDHGGSQPAMAGSRDLLLAASAASGHAAALGWLVEETTFSK